MVSVTANAVGGDVAASDVLDVVAASASSESGSDAGCHSEGFFAASSALQPVSLLQRHLHSHTSRNEC